MAALGVTPEHLAYLDEVVGIRSRFALLQCEVGADGRARAAFFPGSTATGRCAPKGAKFIYHAPKMFRHLIRARPGRVIIELDYAAEESGIVGGLAGCDAMLGAYHGGRDVHLETARLCGMVEPDATKDHPMRKAFKVCNLAVVYQSSVRGIAAQLGVSEGKARYFYDLHHAHFHRVHQFIEDVISTAEAYRLTVLQDGWRKIVPAPFSRSTAANFVIQGTAASILRHAVLGFHDAGLPLLATVHDAAVFEVAIEDAEALIPPRPGSWSRPAHGSSQDCNSRLMWPAASRCRIWPIWRSSRWPIRTTCGLSAAPWACREGGPGGQGGVRDVCKSPTWMSVDHRRYVGRSQTPGALRNILFFFLSSSSS